MNIVLEIKLDSSLEFRILEHFDSLIRALRDDVVEEWINGHAIHVVLVLFKPQEWCLFVKSP